MVHGRDKDLHIKKVDADMCAFMYALVYIYIREVGHTIHEDTGFNTYQE